MRGRVSIMTVLVAAMLALCAVFGYQMYVNWTAQSSMCQIYDGSRGPCE